MDVRAEKVSRSGPNERGKIASNAKISAERQLTGMPSPNGEGRSAAASNALGTLVREKKFKRTPLAEVWCALRRAFTPPAAFG